MSQAILSPVSMALVRGPRPIGDPVGVRQMERRKRRLAEAIKAWTAGLVQVDYEPKYCPAGDSQAVGHVFTAFLSTAAGEDLMVLDDRRIPELRRDHAFSLKLQLIAELGRVGRIYLDLVDDLERQLAADKEAMVDAAVAVDAVDAGA